MQYIYFIYGLSFFTLGIVILFYPKMGNEFRIARTLVFIAIFGIFHGIHEWVEMFALMNQPAEIGTLKVLDVILLPFSFYWLVIFGITSLQKENTRLVTIHAIPTALLVLWAILTAASGQHLLMGNIWARYLLGLPGTALAGYALFRQLADIKRIKTSIKRNVFTAGCAFFLYGIFSGVIVPDASFFPASVFNYSLIKTMTGIPVQLFRTVCAVVLLYNIASILSLFAWETQEQLRGLSLRDELTGLLNRRGFFTLAEQQIKMAQRQNHTMFLLLGDMDDLKRINDTLGHAEGDKAIIEAAAVLKESFRGSDIVARIGGDEFAVLLEKAVERDVKMPLERLKKNFNLHNEKATRQYHLSMSIGMSLYNPNTDSAFGDLLKQADKAMYEEKRKKSS
jgi:diguanylate cyclase (GGDEF)-like protein